MAQPNWTPKLRVVLGHETQEVTLISPRTGNEYKTDVIPQLKVVSVGSIEQTEDGKYRYSIARIIKRYANLAKVPEIQAKGLRHSHVSYLINEINASVLVISKRLGHSSPEITLKHYAHLWSGVDKELALDMSGRIKIETAKTSMIHFNGNQSIKGSVSKAVSNSKVNC